MPFLQLKFLTQVPQPILLAMERALTALNDGSQVVVRPEIRFGKFGNISSETIIAENNTEIVKCMRRRSYIDGRVTSYNISHKSKR